MLLPLFVTYFYPGQINLFRWDFYHLSVLPNKNRSASLFMLSMNSYSCSTYTDIYLFVQIDFFFIGHFNTSNKWSNSPSWG